MESNHTLMSKLKDLSSEINIKKKFAGDTTQAEIEHGKIEKQLINNSSRILNDEFIDSHKWYSTHTTEAEKWDLIIYNDIVCKVLSMYKTRFDEALDVFYYGAKLKGVFTEEEFIMEFGYQDTIKMLKVL